MALAFMLNPSRGRRKSRKAGRRKPAHRRRKRCSTKPGAHLSRRCVGARRAAATRRRNRTAKAVAGTIHVTEGSGRPSFVLNNPRKKRRGRKGARMATKKRKRRSTRRGWTKAKRRRAGRKAWRKRLRRYPKKRSSVKRRGYKNNPRRRKSSRRRRRNSLAIRGMYGNPRKRRRNSRRRSNGRRRRNGAGSNPRKRRRNSHRSRRRRNPLGFSLGGTFGSIQRALTSPDTLMQLAAAAAGGTVSSFLGAWLSAKIADFAPATFNVMDPATKNWGWARRILDAAATIASAILIGGFLPGKYKSAFVLGGGAFALKPIVDQALAPLLSSVGAKAGLVGMAGPGGIGAWISVNQMGRIGMSGMGGRGGMGAWISAQQMANGFRGLGDNQAFDYGQPSQSLMAYDRQPYAGSEAAFTM